MKNSIAVGDTENRTLRNRMTDEGDTSATENIEVATDGGTYARITPIAEEVDETATEGDIPVPGIAGIAAGEDTEERQGSHGENNGSNHSKKAHPGMLNPD